MNPDSKSEVISSYIIVRYQIRRERIINVDRDGITNLSVCEYISLYDAQWRGFKGMSVQSIV